MNKFVIIDPCYLKHTDEEWDKYCDSIDYSKSKDEMTGELGKVFPNIYGIDIENGIGDIGDNECQIRITPKSYSSTMKDIEVVLPCCDSGHHRIFALDDIKDRLHNEDFVGGKSYNKDINTNFCKTFEADANSIEDLAAKADIEESDIPEDDPFNE